MKIFLMLLLLLTLMSCNSKGYSFKQVSQAKPTALIFLSTECPISLKYIAIINKLAEEYPQVTFIGLFPEHETRKSLSQYKSDTNIKFRIIKDYNNTFLRQLGATHTPEAFLLAPDKKVLYRGAIDNWYYDLGQIQREPTDQFLKNAVEHQIQRQPIFLKDTRPVGCRIEQ